MAGIAMGGRRTSSMAAALAVLSFVGLAGFGRPATTSGTNPYYPLVVGAKWTYKATSGPASGKTFTSQVVGGAHSAAGEVFTMRVSTGTGTFLTAHYVLQPNGTVQIQGTSSGGMSFGGNYFLPSAAQVTSCHPCRFTGHFTARVATISILEVLTESVNSLGVHAVTVPAGTFQAEKLGISMKLTGSDYGMTVKDTMNFDEYLAKNVGVVESGNGTVTSSVMGRSYSSSTGNEELMSYTI